MIHLIGLVLSAIIKTLDLKGFAFYDFYFSFHHIILRNMVRILLVMVGYTQPKSKSTRVIGDRPFGHRKGIAFYLEPFLLETDMTACCSLVSEELRIRPRRMEAPIGRMSHIGKCIPFRVSSGEIELEVSILRYYIFLLKASTLQGRRSILGFHTIY